MFDAYDNPNDENWRSDPGMVKSSKKSVAIFGFKLFISGNSCDFASRVIFVCLFFDVQKCFF